MTTLEMSLEGIEKRPLRVFTEQSYLDYSMYVILDRALPHVGDGLKPVQRRIIYAMSELGLSATAKFKKSARTVGDVIGKFHPHGDAACYEAMVHMAQPFAYRYPLIDGQGNWGAPDDPKSFAAMRYTEARLSRHADLLLAELDQGTVDWIPNFDGTLDEPALMPARVPHVLLNGATGIAVGMATDIPPHNLREVVKACLRLLENPAATTAELCEDILGPDYPTEAEVITPRADIVQMYETGVGTIRMRARYERDREGIVITALPHGVSGARVLEQIAQQMAARRLPMIEDLRDESDHENPIRFVIVPRSSRVDAEAVMSHLFASTDLERSYRVNMNVIGLDGRPQVKNLRSLLEEWLRFRTGVVTRRLRHRLEAVERRLHILDALLVCYLNLDEVIRLIREADEPKAELMARFGLTEVQAEAVLNLRLRNLARLEEIRIRDEQERLEAERRDLEQTLGSAVRLRGLIRTELRADDEMFGDDRRSPLVEREAARALDESALLPAEPITVILSNNGWVRAAKGHDIDPAGLAFRSGDGLLAAQAARSNQAVCFIDSHGRTYSLPGHSLPGARGLGEPLTGRLSPPDGARFVGLLAGSDDAAWLLSTSAGHGFVTQLGDLQSRNRAGKAVLTVPPGAEVLPPIPVGAADAARVAVVGSEGHLLVFPAAELPALERGKGVRMLGIPAARASEEKVVAVAVLTEGQALRVVAGQRHMVIRPEELKAHSGARGRRGMQLPRGFRRVDALEPAEDG